MTALARGACHVSRRYCARSVVPTPRPYCWTLVTSCRVSPDVLLQLRRHPLDTHRLLGDELPRYDAVAMGNHDIEPGHSVFDKWGRECKFPLIAANIISDKTGEPYFKPYHVFTRAGLRVAVLGFTTPAIPQWVPAHLWEGLHFDDILTSAAHWVPPHPAAREARPPCSADALRAGE